MTQQSDDPLAGESVLLDQYNQLLETYRQHFDLVMKAIAIYAAIIGTATGFIFKEGAAPAQSVALACFVAGTSAIPAIGHIFGLKWVSALEAPIRQIESRLLLPAFPVSGIRIIIRMCGVFNIIVVIAGVVVARMFSTS